MTSRTKPRPKSPAGSRSSSSTEHQKARAARTSGNTDAGRGAGSEARRRKTTRLEARITDAQKALLQQAAEVRGQTLTEFVVRAGEEAATRVLEHAGVLVLSTQDSAAFVEALLDPPAPNARLRAAAERYRTHREGESGQGKRSSGE